MTMLAVDLVTPLTIILAPTLFFAAFGIASFFGYSPAGSRGALLAILFMGLGFLLYRETADYGYGRASGDYDFGFPFRWITTQNDSDPVRFRLWALAADIAAGTALWGIFQRVRRYAKIRSSKPNRPCEASERSP